MQNDEEMVEEQKDDHKSNPQDPRHVRRVGVMQLAFAYTFLPSPETQSDFLIANPEMVAFIGKLTELDEKIQVAASERPLDQINKVDLAILRTIMFEWETSHTPVKVLINEGVEIAKEFGTESSPKFVNGVLAKLLTEQEK
jgi:N utilization substance protein B